MNLELVVDRSLCIGAGQCVHWAPGVFTLPEGEEEPFIASVGDPRAESEEKVLLAVLSCPRSAISMVIDGTIIREEELRNWILGANKDVPWVEDLLRLSTEHEELRSILTDDLDSFDSLRLEQLSTLLEEHMAGEKQVYASIREFVAVPLLESFTTEHEVMESQLADLLARSAGGAVDAATLAELATTVDELIRLEETVLFPLALSALADLSLPST